MPRLKFRRFANSGLCGKYRVGQAAAASDGQGRRGQIFAVEPEFDVVGAQYIEVQVGVGSVKLSYILIVRDAATRYEQSHRRGTACIRDARRIRIAGVEILSETYILVAAIGS